MNLNSLFPGLLWLCMPLVRSESLTGSKLLVVLEDAELKSSFSQFFEDLEKRGYELDIQSPKNEGLELLRYGEKSYSHVILFPPKSKGYGPALTPQKLVEFVGKDGNILLLTSPSSIPEQSRELCRELEIDIPPRDYLAVDHFNYDRLSASERHDLILIPRPMRSRTTQSYFSQRKNSEGDNDEIIAFRGAGHTLSNKPLLFPILTASNTAYTYDTRESSTFADDPSAAGSQMHYVTAFQSRNNARITISGSTDLFSNELFDMQVQAPSGKKTTTANRAFAKELTQWTFKETGIVKVAAIRHFLSNETHPEINPSIYRVKNDVTFEIELTEWSVDHWKPFNIPSQDSLQLEFTMLDPYYRLPLLPIKGTKDGGRLYSASFKAPDQHGIFAFRVNYKRPFVNYIDEKYSVTVRHFAHDEYTRSWAISGAWVWIAGIAVTIGGWIAFCGLWLYSAPPHQAGNKKTQ